MNRRPLDGVRVATTRDRPGELDLEQLGATVVAVPLIEITDPVDSAPLESALERVDEFDWLVVTSRHGAARVGAAVADRDRPRLAAVGSATAAELAVCSGRTIDLVPDLQRADALADALEPLVGGTRVLVAHADRARPELVDRLAGAGADVTAVDAYRTVDRVPTAAERATLMGADAVAFASGSAAESWAAAMDRWTPPIVVAIGPSTASAAKAAGIGVTHIAARHSIDGLVERIVDAAGR